jgi:hypothetical protein
MPSGETAKPALSVRLRRVLLWGLGFGALASLLYAKAIPCAFARIFHLPCPGCGSTRAVVALLSGDLDGVVRNNPLGPVAALLLGALAAQALLSMLTHGDFRDAGSGVTGQVVKRAVVVIVALEVALWIARFFGALGGPVSV